MKKIQLGFLMIALTASLLPGHHALAQTAQRQTGPSANGPKPLLADPAKPSAASDDKDKLDPSGIPKEYAALRQNVKDEFNAWMKDDQAIQKECDAARTVGERALCDRKKTGSQARLDRVHQHTREMQYKIEAWRNKQRGLPPPDWSPYGNAAASKPPVNGSGNSSSGTEARPAPALLPQNGTALPPGTF